MLQSRRRFVGNLGICLAASGSLLKPRPVQSQVSIARQDQPNFIIFTFDDLYWRSVGVFGQDQPSLTPNLDAFAETGVSFVHSHVPIASCWPSRAAMMSGRYPHRNGSTGFREVDPDVLTLPEVLREQGYFTGVIGKNPHTLPKRTRAFDFEARDWEVQSGRNPELFYRQVSQFLRLARDQGKPFFLNVNSSDPHRPFAGSAEEQSLSGTIQSLVRGLVDTAGLEDQFPEWRYWGHPLVDDVVPLDQAVVPGFLPDLPEVRAEMAQYSTSVRRGDRSFGRTLDAVNDQGYRETTFVLALSDNSIAMPFAKANSYRYSTAAALVAAWPDGRFAVRQDDTSFINTVDLMPTVLEAAGLPLVPHLDGRSFLSVLRGELDPSRTKVFTFRHSYPMRAVHDAEYSYIYNGWADGETSFQKIFSTTPSARAIAAAAKSDPDIAQRWSFYLYRTREELYNYKDDPYCLTNLADDQDSSDTLKRYRSILSRHMSATDDNLRAQFDTYLGL